MPHGNRPTHPRPQLRRRQWSLLDGEWEFAFDADAPWETP